MGPCSDDHIAHLLRLKRYEQPPPGYFENFLHEYRRRQRDRLVRQSRWRICFERAETFVLRLNIRFWAPAGIAVMVAFVAVFSIRLYQQPGITRVVGHKPPIPSTPSNTQNELDFAPRVLIPAFDMQPTLLPSRRDVPVLPIDSDQFVPLRLEP